MGSHRPRFSSCCVAQSPQHQRKDKKERPPVREASSHREETTASPTLRHRRHTIGLSGTAVLGLRAKLLVFRAIDLSLDHERAVAQSRTRLSTRRSLTIASETPRGNEMAARLGKCTVLGGKCGCAFIPASWRVGLVSDGEPQLCGYGGYKHSYWIGSVASGPGLSLCSGSWTYCRNA
jgi:hypothetical protein